MVAAPMSGPTSIGVSHRLQPWGIETQNDQGLAASCPRLVVAIGYPRCFLHFKRSNYVSNDCISSSDVEPDQFGGLGANCRQMPAGPARFECAMKNPAFAAKLERCQDEGRKMGLSNQRSASAGGLKGLHESLIG